MENNRIFIIGGGLSGLSAAISLAQAGNADITILEQGCDYKARIESANPDHLCGLGGAGTIGGGKLCFPPASGKIWRKTQYSLPEFSSFKEQFFTDPMVAAPSSPLPLIRTEGRSLSWKRYDSTVLFKDTMNKWVSDLISLAVALGVNIRCGCTYLKHVNEKQGINIFFRNEDSCIEMQNTSYLLFATGRSSARMLNTVFAPSVAPMPDLGIRLSLDRKQEYAFSAIGRDIKLKSTIGDYSLRTFCVCSGGDSTMVTKGPYRYFDGHFAENDTGVVNLGILARSGKLSGFSAADDFLAAMQKYVHADMSLKDFLRHKDTLARRSQYEPLFDAIAQFVEQLVAAGLITQNADEIPVMIPSVDRLNSYIVTDRNFQTLQPGVFVIGDASGISRGFVQAMWSGHCAAESIKRRMLLERENRRAM